MSSESSKAGRTPSTHDANDVTWHFTREGSSAPSEVSTPGVHHDAFDDDAHVNSARTGRNRAESSASSIDPRWSATSSRATSPPRRSRPLGIDAEDEDVRIAIMALGAMRNLDGKSRASSEEQSRASSSMLTDEAPRSTGSLRPKGKSRSSVSSAAATDASGTSSPPKSSSALAATPSMSSTTSTPLSTPTTLANLPADFEFPAILQDEKGNEVRVDREMMKDADFLRRVSHLPIVRGTLRAYELGKQHSKVVKYGGDLVESGVKALSRPVVSRLGASLGERGVEQLDDFACRQLDKIYPKMERLSKEERATISQELEQRERTQWKGLNEDEMDRRKRAFWALKVEEKERAMATAELRQRKGKGKGRASVEEFDDDRMSAAAALVRSDSHSQLGSQASASTRQSGWGSMLAEASYTAGGLSAAVSEESMKSLKYCLQWLQYATAHIEHQITVLRDLMVKLNHGELDMSSPAAQNLQAIKGDVVGTIRNVVDVVGKYAGGALPEPARGSVKAFILSLPARWATVNRAQQVTGGAGSPNGGSFGGSPASPSFSPAHVSDGASSPSAHLSGRALQSPAARQQQMQRAATTQAANRVLALAVESLDILRSVTVVFGESLDRADLWVERLRVLGLHRKRAHEQAAAEEAAARIDDGMGGALGSRGTWEDARGYGGSRSASPGAESNVSMQTTASSKRRRVRGSAGAPSSRSHSPAATPSWHMSTTTRDEEGSGGGVVGGAHGHAGASQRRRTKVGAGAGAGAGGGAGSGKHHGRGASRATTPVHQDRVA